MKYFFLGVALRMKATLNIRPFPLNIKFLSFFPNCYRLLLTYFLYTFSSQYRSCTRIKRARWRCKGRCVSRGLFVAGDGSVVNANVNAAYNILRKAFPHALAEGIEDASLHPVRMPLGTACECT
jgi:hypothetical protein